MMDTETNGTETAKRNPINAPWDSTREWTETDRKNEALSYLATVLSQHCNPGFPYGTGFTNEFTTDERDALRTYLTQRMSKYANACQFSN